MTSEWTDLDKPSSHIVIRKQDFSDHANLMIGKFRGWGEGPSEDAAVEFLDARDICAWDDCESDLVQVLRA